MQAEEEVAFNIGATPETSGRERRRDRRASCSGFAEVIVSRTGYLFRGEILDLSMTGCLVGTKARVQLEPASKLELRFALKNNGFHLHGWIANVRAGLGIGIEFAPIKNEDLRAKLHALCQELNTGLVEDQQVL